MSKHVFYDVDEVSERMAHEFAKGMNALDSLEAEIRSTLDALTAMQFHTDPPPRRPRPRAKKSAAALLPLTAADHLAADLLAQELAGRKGGGVMP